MRMCCRFSRAGQFSQLQLDGGVMMGCSSHAQRSGHRWVFKREARDGLKRARVRQSVVSSERAKEREGRMDWTVVDGNLQSLCSSAVMSTINKRTAQV